jgi:hypothetical protein
MSSVKYNCIAFFANNTPKRWHNVDKLDGFVSFLNKSHSEWQYFNVYDCKTKKYLTRFYPHSLIPQYVTR